VRGCSLLPLHPLIDHQGHATLELHSGLGRDGFDLGDIQVKSVMQREHLALHSWTDHSGLAFHLDGFILPDDEVADLQAKGFLLPGVHLGSPIIAGVTWDELPIASHHLGSRLQSQSPYN